MIRKSFFFTIILVSFVCALDSGTISRIQARNGKAVADSLIAIITDAGNSGLPVMPLENKVREGLAKKRPGPELLAAVNARSELLARIRMENGGTLPEEYIKLLFALEKNRPPLSGKDPFLNKEPPSAGESGPKAADVAKAYGVSIDSVERLKTAYSTGYGNLAKAFALSTKSGLSVTVILQMKTVDKLGWGEIAQKLDLAPGKDYKIDASAGQEKNDEALEKQQTRMENRAEQRIEKMEKRINRGKGPNNP